MEKLAVLKESVDQQFEKVDGEQSQGATGGRKEEGAVSGFLLFSWNMTNWFGRPGRNEYIDHNEVLEGI